MTGVEAALQSTDLPATMPAVRLVSWAAAPQEVEVPVPRPGPGQALLRVDAAGLCHSDLHVMDAPAGRLPYALPFTLGHEVVGTVVAVGDAEDASRLGEQCAVHGVWSCGACRACRAGRDNHCAALTGPVGGGLGLDGGLAEYVLVPALRHLVPASGIDPVALAPLTDAGLTTFHALRPHLEQLGGAAVAVVGVGGLGHLAVQLLARRAAAVVAVDPRAEARALADRSGATRSVADVREAAAVLQELVGTAHADLVLDLVGTEDTLVGAAALLAPGGELVLVGSAGGRLTVGKGGSLPRGWGVRAPFWGPRADLVDVVALAAQGVLHAETEIHGLHEALAAYDRLRAGDVRGRAVVVPGGAPAAAAGALRSAAGSGPPTNVR